MKVFRELLGHRKPDAPECVWAKNVIVGECAILRMPDNSIVRTSPVTGFSFTHNRGLEIVTRNNIYTDGGNEKCLWKCQCIS